MTAVIETRGLTKTYGTVRALDGLDLSIPRGGVYGVLGPNGAGKSTLFRVLLGLIRPTDGTATVMGGPVGQASTMRRMGSMIETPRFPPFMTAREVLNWLALGHGARDADLDHWLARVGLTEAADRKVRGFSVGMAQRLGVAAALMTKPELVILDEPTSGMDPPGIQEMRALIRSLADVDGVTVVLASHQLLEVQRVCDRVAILNKGKLVREGRVSDLTAEGGERLRLTVADTAPALAVLGARGAVEGAAVLAAVQRSEAPDLFRALVAGGVDIQEARWVGTDLESIFFAETGGVQTVEPDHAG